MNNPTTTGGQAGEPDRTAAMFTPEAAALFTELSGLDAQQFAIVYARAEAAAAAAEAAWLAAGGRPLS